MQARGQRDFVAMYPFTIPAQILTLCGWEDIF